VTPEPSTENFVSKYLYLTLAALVLALDQFSKYWVAVTLWRGGEVPVIDGFLKLSYTENPGIAFGMLSDGDLKWFLIAISVAALIVVGYYMTKTPPWNRLLLWSLSLLSAGIAGNLVDRVRMGRVIDFIEVYYRDVFTWPVFNVADSAITIGAALMAIELFLAPQPTHPIEGQPEPVAGDGTTNAGQ
jgi:signal peptidase II